MDALYDRKYEDMQNRLDQLYEKIDTIEIEMDEIKTRIQNIKLDKLNADNIYNILRMFDQLYDKFTDTEKQEFIKSFVEKIDIYSEALEDGRILKNIKFRFPVFFNGSEVKGISWDKESTVEIVALLVKE